MALRIKVDGSGSTQPKLLDSVNDPDDFLVPGWRGADDWVAPCVPNEETGEGGVNFASVNSGYPVWDGSLIHTQSGAMTLGDFFELHNVSEADQAYFRQQLNDAWQAAMETQEGHADAAFVNCRPWWNARCAAVKRGSGGKLPVSGRTLRLRVRPSFYGVSVVVKPTPMTIEATFACGLKEATAAARVTVKKPNTATPSPIHGGWVFDSIDNIVKEGEAYIPVVTAWLDTIDKIAYIQGRQSSMLATCAGLEEVNKVYEVTGLTDTPANDLSQVPFFSAHPEMRDLLNRLYPPALSDGPHQYWLPGVYFDANGEPLFVRPGCDYPNGFLEESDIDRDVGEWEGPMVKSGVSATAPNGIDVDLTGWRGSWDNDGEVALRPATEGPTQGEPLTCPVLINAYWSGTETWHGQTATIRIKTGNKGNPVAGADKVHLTFYGYEMQYGDGSHYTGAEPTDDSSPFPSRYQATTDSEGRSVMAVEIDLKGVLQKETVDGEERWAAGQDVTLSYYISLAAPISLSPGCFHCGFSAGSIGWPQEAEATSYSPGPYDFAVTKYDQHA